MNIYFCGIGGVGLGPLAELALDAGHTVQGSEPDDTRITRQLAARGVAINKKQKGMFLQACHGMKPIDWFVYTSALPDDHPELVLARMLGIKTTKRDELLLHILREKDLKLIAVAGTHGKTTTTSMLVWSFMQLEIPVSYSIGTTMSFAPSGHYESGSQYFIYECDEFDRNFLQFHPHVSLITSIDYDHPDTYSTPDDYLAAFRQFAAQSEHTIIWQRDAGLIGAPESSWTLGDHDIADVQLPGQHNRMNASLVIKTIEHLGLPGDAQAALNSFPGVDRRFERIAANLYSDYGHHPVEIAATLQMARELADDVVLVYQPHQNIRQHELRTQYDDCFEAANEVYWLPTYLTREDPALPILSPQELAEYITNYDAVRFADLDDTLWENIQKARDRGALVLVMGAGSVDGWLRQKAATRHVASIILLDSEGNFILQQRDVDTNISSSGKVATFGGSVEPEDTSLHDAAVRELREETNIEFDPNDLTFFKLRFVVDENDQPSIRAYYILSGISTDNLEVHEGQGFIKISPNELNKYPLSLNTRTAITEYIHPAMV